MSEQPLLSTPLVDVRAVEKRYRQGDGWLPVLKGISLTVAEGEFVAVVGPSGAGKSTLLHLIGGLDLPSAGEIAINGRAWGALAPREQARARNETIGFVFQCYHLLPELTVLENAMLPALVGRRREPTAAIRSRALGVLRGAGLGERLTHRPAQLSGGEQQRVAIARALMNAPRLLLCDEPTGNLDAATGAAILEMLQQWHRQQRATMIMVTHDAALTTAADRVVPMHDGQVVMQVAS